MMSAMMMNPFHNSNLSSIWSPIPNCDVHGRWMAVGVRSCVLTASLGPEMVAVPIIDCSARSTGKRLPPLGHKGPKRIGVCHYFWDCGVGMRMLLGNRQDQNLGCGNDEMDWAPWLMASDHVGLKQATPRWRRADQPIPLSFPAWLVVEG